MKTIKALFVFAFAVAIVPVAKAQQFNYKLDGPFKVTRSFKVNGVCEMCKNRIEASVKRLSGVWFANWNVSSKTLQADYDKSKDNPAKIEQVVALVGRDVENKKAADEIYLKLPDCCHYKGPNNVL